VVHIEILVEDSSGEKLLQLLLPQIIGDQGNPHTWRLHSYKGIGRIPAGLISTADPSKRILLDQLPKLLRGYSETPGIDAIVVVLDADKRNCVDFLIELKGVANTCRVKPVTLFRLAIEEMESWYLGDRNAILQAYPKVKQDVLNRYVQDEVCGTWELLADALYRGGSAAVKNVGWPLSGQLKHEWAANIGPNMAIDQNLSPSFRKLRDGLCKLIS
jgi:hypothetical protein